MNNNRVFGNRPLNEQPPQPGQPEPKSRRSTWFSLGAGVILLLVIPEEMHALRSMVCMVLVTLYVQLAK